MTKALPYIFTSFGYGTWFFFASWMLLASTWAYFMLPETKGLTLSQMDVILYVKLNKPIPNVCRSFWLTLILSFPQRLQLRGTPWYPAYIRHD